MQIDNTIKSEVIYYKQNFKGSSANSNTFLDSQDYQADLLIKKVKMEILLKQVSK